MVAGTDVKRHAPRVVRGWLVTGDVNQPMSEQETAARRITVMRISVATLATSPSIVSINTLIT
jgi:hypothetical protein